MLRLRGGRETLSTRASLSAVLRFAAALLIAGNDGSPRAWHRDLSEDPRIYRSAVEVDCWLSVRCVAGAEPPG